MGFLSALKQVVSTNIFEQTSIKLIAPLSGEIVDLSEVPDPVFADKIVGDGIAIRPTGNKMVAPCDGVIGKIFDTNHAFSLETDTGIELFVHFGIDTVKLDGKGFTRIAQEGQKVKSGDEIMAFDLEFLTANAKSILTPVIISNMEDIKELNKESGTVEVATDTVLEIIK